MSTLVLPERLIDRAARQLMAANEHGRLLTVLDEIVHQFGERSRTPGPHSRALMARIALMLICGRLCQIRMREAEDVLALLPPARCDAAVVAAYGLDGKVAVQALEENAHPWREVAVELQIPLPELAVLLALDLERGHSDLFVVME